MGAPPRWYRLVKAAQYLGSTPWDLEERGWRYVRQAEEALYSENWASNDIAERRHASSD